MNIDDLLAAERTRKGFTTAERAAMWRGIQSSIGGAAVASAAATAAAKTAPKAAAKAASKIAKWKLATMLTMAAIAGAGAGAAAHAKWAAPTIVTVERVVPVAAPPAETVVIPAMPTAAAEPATSVTASAAPAPMRVVPVAKPSASAAKDPSLARERTLLDMARTALSRGDTTAALASLDTHAREFPHSQLAEEREVLAIQALASAGRMPEARRRAAAFRTRFVNSPLTPIVDEATQ